MKKTLIPLIVAALVVGAPMAHAEKGRTDNERPEREEQNAFDKVRSLIREKVEEKKIEIENEREGIQKEAVERKVKVLEARKEDKTEIKNEIRVIGIQRSAEKTTAMLNAMVARFDKLIERITSRVEKVAAAGGDTKISVEKLDAAKADLAKARAQIEALKKIDLSLGSTTGSTTVSTTLKTNFQAYKDAVKAVKDTFKLVHKDLEGSVRALKMGESNVKATTTAETTGQ